MIETLATIDILETAIDKIDDGKIEDAKDDLVTYKDKLQNEVDEFEKWAKVQSDIDTSIQLEVDNKLGKQGIVCIMEKQIRQSSTVW